MQHFLILLFILSASTQVFGVHRFEKDQLKFSLLESDGRTVTCQHEPLKNQSPAPPPPWWTVTCDDRTYVADVWMDSVKKQQSYATDFMVHVKESTSSSGEKITRFDSHLTRFEFEERLFPKSLSSFIDVRNGLSDLKVQVSLK